LDSSLEFDNANIEENNILFNEITGQNKWKNEFELTQEEKLQKANRSEVRQVKGVLEELIYLRREEQEYKREERKRKEIERKQREDQRRHEFGLLISALHSLNNMALPQTNNGIYYLLL
jgi:hypothetical protein